MAIGVTSCPLAPWHSGRGEEVQDGGRRVAGTHSACVFKNLLLKYS